MVFIVAGCSFGEYADEENSTSTSSDGTYVEFSESGLEDKVFYRVYKIDGEWSISSYDFNGTNFTVSPITNSNTSLSGTYSVTSEGYIKLVSLDVTWYIKGISEDDDKISLLWTTDYSDLTSSTPSSDTYFFKTKSKASSFITTDSTETNSSTQTTTETNSSTSNILPAIYNLLL